MRKAKLLIAAMFMAVTLGLPAKAVFAAAVSLTQADFTFADCDDTTANAKGIICYDLGTSKAYGVPAGEYMLGENISLGAGSIFTNGASFSLDLNGKTLSNSIDGNTVLELDSTNNVISGTGTIASTGYSNGVSAYGVFDDEGNLTTRNNVVINGNPNIRGLNANGVTLTINGGTFTSTGLGGALDLGDNGITTINNATVTTTNSDGVYIYGGKLTINGGTFTANSFSAITSEGVLDSLTITGGTFSGNGAGLALVGVPRSAALSGGTFITTGETGGIEVYGPITLAGEVDPTDLDSLLAEGASYSDPTATRTGDAPFYFVYLTNKNVTITNGSTPTPAPAEESSSTIGAPDSGRSTKETSATTSILATLLTSSAILGGIYASKKHLAKKQA